MAKTVQVKAGMRKGKMVKAHTRNVRGGSKNKKFDASLVYSHGKEYKGTIAKKHANGMVTLSPYMDGDKPKKVKMSSLKIADI